MPINWTEEELQSMREWDKMVELTAKLTKAESISVSLALEKDPSFHPDVVKSAIAKRNAAYRKYYSEHRDKLRAQARERWKRFYDNNKAAINAKRRIKDAERRAHEAPERRAARLAYMRKYHAERIASETPDQREARLAYMREYSAEWRTRMTPEQRERKRAYMRKYHAERIARETPEQREARLAYLREYRRTLKQKRGENHGGQE